MGLTRPFFLLFVLVTGVAGALVATSPRGEAPESEAQSPEALEVRITPAAAVDLRGIERPVDTPAGSRATPVVPPSTATPSVRPTAEPVTDRTAGSTQPPQAPVRLHEASPASVHSLFELQREVERYLLGSEGYVGVALYSPSAGMIFGREDSHPFPLASLGKVQIMLTYMDLARRQKIPLTADEVRLLEDMITVSDNDAAEELWYRMGGGEAMRAYLAAHGLATDTVNPDALWGDDRGDTAREQAKLFALLWAGQLLGPEDTDRAISLLARVQPYQKWGISAGLDWKSTARPQVYLKNGWYPGVEGWRVNSAGLIKPAGAAEPYVLVILADSQPTFEYGLETVETVAKLVNGFMTSPNVSLPTRTAR
jgi:hypothetical protein